MVYTHDFPISSVALCCVEAEMVRLIDMEPRKRWELAKEASSKYAVVVYVTVLSDTV